MREVKVPAFAKINLRLDIVGKRADNYHELRTIFQSISLHDELLLRTSRNPGITLTIHGNAQLAQEPCGKNLVYRAVDALRHELKIRTGVEIDLHKNNPRRRRPGRRLQQCRSRAARLPATDGKKLPPPRLIEIAVSLGADVPFFLFGGRALGVNQRRRNLPARRLKKHTTSRRRAPRIHVPTPETPFRWVEALRHAIDKIALQPLNFGSSVLCAGARREPASRTILRRPFSSVTLDWQQSRGLCFEQEPQKPAGG